jgi:hypothetical protein
VTPDNHRQGVIQTVDYATGLATVTVGGTTLSAKVIGEMPAVLASVWVEQRGDSRSDWVVIGTNGPPTVQPVTGQLMMPTSLGDVILGTAQDACVISPAISIPVWAQDGAHHLFVEAVCNPEVITAAGVFQVRVVIGGTLPDEGTLAQCQVAGDASNQFTIVVAGTFTIAAATTTLAPKVSTWRTGGTGALRWNTAAAPQNVLWKWKIY